MDFTNGDVADAAANNGGNDTGSVVENFGGDSQATGDNPAWNDLLDVLPSEFHPMVKPTLEKWDSGVNKRFETVHSQYAPYKPFIEQQITPDEISAAMQMMNLLATDPRKVYDKLGEFYGADWGLGSGQGQPNTNDDDEFDLDGGNSQQANVDLENNPYIKQIQEQQNTIAQFLAAQIEREERAKIDSEIDQQFSNVQQKYGELSQEDVNIIVSIATTQDKTVEEAAEVLFGRLGQVQQQSPSAGLPPIVPTGGGVPNAPINPAELSPKDTRSLVENILRNAAQQNQ